MKPWEALELSGRCEEVLIAAGIPADCLDRGQLGRPCPRCGGTDRFAPLPDLPHRGALHCRICFSSSSPVRPGGLLESVRWWLGVDFRGAAQWIEERFGENGSEAPVIAAPVARPAPPRPAPSIVISEEDRRRLREIADSARRDLSPEAREREAQRLGVAAWALEAFGVGLLSGYGGEWLTWPMASSRGELSGIRLRSLDGSRKISVKGSRAGLFLPLDLDELVFESRGFVAVAEGPTSAAAALSIGIPAIGLPSAGSGHLEAAEAITSREISMVAILADPDEPGERSAAKLLSILSERGVVAVVIAPSAGRDPREWIRLAEDRGEIRRFVMESVGSRLRRLRDGKLQSNTRGC